VQLGSTDVHGSVEPHYPIGYALEVNACTCPLLKRRHACEHQGLLQSELEAPMSDNIGWPGKHDPHIAECEALRAD
jgi:hypothetical protein